MLIRLHAQITSLPPKTALVAERVSLVCEGAVTYHIKIVRDIILMHV